jgi:uncharacterized protein
MHKKKIEIYIDKKREYRARLKAANGEIVAASEGYSRKENAVKWAKKLAKWGSNPKIVDLTK